MILRSLADTTSIRGSTASPTYSPLLLSAPNLVQVVKPSCQLHASLQST